MTTWRRFTKWLESHPAMTGLIATAIALAGAVAGWMVQATFQSIEVHTASAAAATWKDEFTKWQTKYQEWKVEADADRTTLEQRFEKHYLAEVDRSKEHNTRANTRANNAANTRASKFDNWLKQKEDDYIAWIKLRTESIERDRIRINHSNEKAQATATKAVTTAERVSKECDEAESELRELRALSKELRKDTGDLPNQVATLLLSKRDLLASPLASELGKQAPPIGSVMAWPGPINDTNRCPPGWHLCDGTPLLSLAGLTESGLNKLRAALPADIYKGLLPDFQGYFLRGFGGVDPDKNRALGIPQAQDLKEHLHAIKDPGHFHSISYGVGRFAPGHGVFERTHGGGAGPSPRTEKKATGIDKTLKTGGVETRPVNYAVNWIIRIK